MIIGAAFPATLEGEPGRTVNRRRGRSGLDAIKSVTACGALRGEVAPIRNRGLRTVERRLRTEGSAPVAGEGVTMNREDLAGDDGASSFQLIEINRICDYFEQAWRGACGR